MINIKTVSCTTNTYRGEGAGEGDYREITTIYMLLDNFYFGC